MLFNIVRRARTYEACANLIYSAYDPVPATDFHFFDPFVC